MSKFDKIISKISEKRNFGFLSLKDFEYYVSLVNQFLNDNKLRKFTNEQLYDICKKNYNFNALRSILYLDENTDIDLIHKLVLTDNDTRTLLNVLQRENIYEKTIKEVIDKIGLKTLLNNIDDFDFMRKTVHSNISNKDFPFSQKIINYLYDNYSFEETRYFPIKYNKDENKIHELLNSNEIVDDNIVNNIAVNDFLSDEIRDEAFNYATNICELTKLATDKMSDDIFETAISTMLEKNQSIISLEDSRNADFLIKKIMIEKDLPYDMQLSFSDAFYKLANNPDRYAKRNINAYFNTFKNMVLEKTVFTDILDFAMTNPDITFEGESTLDGALGNSACPQKWIDLMVDNYLEKIPETKILDKKASFIKSLCNIFKTHTVEDRIEKIKNTNVPSVFTQIAISEFFPFEYKEKLFENNKNSLYYAFAKVMNVASPFGKDTIDVVKSAIYYALEMSGAQTFMHYVTFTHCYNLQPLSDNAYKKISAVINEFSGKRNDSITVTMMKLFGDTIDSFYKVGVAKQMFNKRVGLDNFIDNASEDINKVSFALNKECFPVLDSLLKKSGITAQDVSKIFCNSQYIKVFQDEIISEMSKNLTVDVATHIEFFKNIKGASALYNLLDDAKEILKEKENSQLENDYEEYPWH